MIRILRQIFHTGIVTEPIPKEISAEIEQVGAKLEENCQKTLQQKPCYTAGGCRLM